MAELEEVPVSKNPQIQTYVQTSVNGKAAAAREAKRQSKLRALALSGIVKPATLLNFNPFPISSPEGGMRVTVPACNDKNVPDDMKLAFQFKGKQYLCTYVTVRNAEVYPRITDVRSEDDELVGQYDFDECHPMEIIHAMYVRAAVGAQDSLQMHGVIMFVGDKHALKKPDGKKNEPLIVQVPKFEILADRRRQFFAEPQEFAKLLDSTLTLQKTYCDMQLQLAGAYNDDPEQRKNITSVHRTWHQFALDMGWKEKPAAWMVSIDDPTDTCIGCGAARARADAFFCHKCNRPYDAYAAFMAGEDVPQSYLVAYKGDQWNDIVKESKRRKERAAELS